MSLRYKCSYVWGTINAFLANYINERRRTKHKQYWQAGALGGGGTISLGFMTEAGALEKLQSIKGDNEPVVFVDFDRGFIAYGKQPDSG